ncbi:MAG: PLP-dependent aminotransferase family protein [Planctomycetes bacterium]|nr:PLP-dependent aminotransferase family protein [Planctomycetota bacterium]
MELPTSDAPVSDIPLSVRARHTHDQPISYFMQQAVENPGLISLAAGLVDAESLPADEVRQAFDEILSRPRTAQAALQYGTTQGFHELREKVLAHAAALDSRAPADLSLTPGNVVITTGSQQLLYLLGEVLFDPGDIVITEAPSYFVYHGILASLGVRTMQVPMDDAGMNTNALEELLIHLEKTGELERVKLIYTVDYFQNPSGLTLSLPRRRHMMELARRFSKKHHLFILEDAAYRELRYDGADLPSIKSLDEGNRHVLLAMTFSKPLSPGLKIGYGLLPTELMAPLLRFKGSHDFGSCNLAQHLVHRLLDNGAYDRHVARLCDVYRAKRDALLETLAEEFPADTPGLRWTRPEGGLYVWLTMPVETGPDSAFLKAALREGVLYVPGQFCYVRGAGHYPKNEARLCYGVAPIEQLKEAVRRLGRAAVEVGAVPACGLAR